MRDQSLKELKRVYVLGVGGTLMAPFACFMKRQGIEVSGSDQNLYPPMSEVLAHGGVRLFQGYGVSNLDQLEKEGGKVDLVIVGNVISRTHPEAVALMERGYKFTSLPAAMEKLLLPQTRNLVVSGTHGKTTTSSLLAATLARLGRDPSYFIGGVCADLPQSFHVSEKPGEFVLEGDEYDTAFWDKVPKFTHYLPNDVILTSIEYDHADIYPSLESVEDAFRTLIRKIRKGGNLILCLETSSARKLAPEVRSLNQELGQVLTYGREGSGADYEIRQVKVESEVVFEVWHEGASVETLILSLTGEHNALNALSVWIELHRVLGIPSAQVVEALREFRGVKRRQEVRGEIDGRVVIDDFAHHPTAIRETLLALRMKFPGKKILVAFEPRSATSRRKVFQTEFAESLSTAQGVAVSVPYDPSKIPESERFSSSELVRNLRDQGVESWEFDPEAPHATFGRIRSSTQPGDVIAVFSNGGFSGFIPKILANWGDGVQP